MSYAPEAIYDDYGAPQRTAVSPRRMSRGTLTSLQSRRRRSRWAPDTATIRRLP